MAWHFITPKGRGRVCVHRAEEGPASILRVRLAYVVDGTMGAMNLTVGESQRLSLELEGVDAAPRTMAIPPQSPVELIGRRACPTENAIRRSARAWPSPR